MSRVLLPTPEGGYPHREHRSKKGQTYNPRKKSLILRKIRKQKKEDKYLNKELCPTNIESQL